MARLTVSDYGRIKFMPFPSGWLELEEQTDGATILAVSSPENERVRFGFYHRGGPINRYSALEFLTVLQMEPHTVSDYERDILGVVLRTMDDVGAFRIETIETLCVNGQMVLSVDGLWINSGLRERGFFTNVDDRGEYIQELHFFAPQREFFTHLSEVMECVNSIQWRPEYSDTFPAPSRTG